MHNFRGFSDHKVEFGPQTILIGQNNAGKTTVIEALRVLSVCQRRVPTANYEPAPEWLDGHCHGAGFRLSLETIDFDFTNVQHAYDSERPAIIRAKNSNHTELHIYLGRNAAEVFCQIRLSQRVVVHNRSMATKDFGRVKVMPPIGSLLAHEKKISKDRLNKYLNGYLSYRHFRNQLWERQGDYRSFKRLLEASWNGLAIQHFEDDHGSAQNEFSLLIREGRFTSEISWHGHGLQAWMQTVWFLSRTDRSDTIVLDEPDVYLHADLQRKLIKLIESREYDQAIVATHSSEIIGDVPFNNVTIVQKRDKISRPAKKANDIQCALRSMGSLHSIQLAKVAQHGLIFCVEGDDQAFLSDVAYKIGTSKFDTFSSLAVQEIKGKGNWEHAIGASKALREASSGEIGVALLLDRDYMLDKQRDDYYEKATKEGLILKIWHKKEIENYFIIAGAISRLVSQRSKIEVDKDTIENFICEIEKEVQEDLILSFADVLQKASSSRIEPKTAVKRAKEYVGGRIAEGERIRDLAGGKEMISRLSGKCQEAFSISFNALAICKSCYVHEIDAELIDLINGLAAPKQLHPGFFVTH